MQLIFLLDILIYLPFLVILSVVPKFAIIYIPFLIILIKDTICIIKGKEKTEGIILKNLVYTIMLPDNFVVIFFSGIALLYFIIKLLRKKIRLNIEKDKVIIITTLVGLLLINVILNKVHLLSFLLYLFYIFVFLVSPIVLFSCKEESIKYVDKALNTAIIIQCVPIIGTVILHLGYVLSNLFGDWSIGTMGISQGVQLFSLFIFVSIKFLCQYFISKDKKHLGFFVICFLFAITTSTLVHTVLFLVAVTVYAVIYKSNKKTKIGLVALILFFGCVFWFGSGSFVREQFTRIAFDSAYRNERIKKAEVYEDTFINLPKKDLKAGIVGIGVGNYSSRAALTASGYYTTWYNSNRFPIYVDKYAKKYIRPRLYKNIGLSILETPTSQYISVMGEFGYLGIIVFISIAVYAFIKSKNVNKLLLAYFLMTLFFDNYLEYPKISLLFICCYFIISNTSFLKRTNDEGLKI